MTGLVVTVYHDRTLENVKRKVKEFILKIEYDLTYDYSIT